MLDVNVSHTDVWDALLAQAHALLTSPRRVDSTPAVRLARSLHTAPPSAPAAVRAHLHDAPHVLPALARYAQTGRDRHALLMAAVLMRDRLRAIAGGQDSTDTLAVFWTLIRTAAEPDTLTEQSVAHQLAKRLHALIHRPAPPVVIEPHDPHAAVFDQAPTEPDRHAQAAQLLEDARAHRVITALEHRTLTVLYLQGIGSLTVAAHTLDANTRAIERRAQRAIRKLAAHYRDPHRAAA
ncbi:hypothetical protein [Mycobacterium riyadhense]|uniref:hypothetical protein n=1 Tax=Mycobacterium riyadhense TaxID=486698 RepID=UPI001957BC2A|nr:hypothetical protein [Mycobacterium riyadhense]